MVTIVYRTHSDNVCLLIRNGSVMLSAELTADEGRRLAAKLIECVDRLPRVASASDLGIEEVA